MGYRTVRDRDGIDWQVWEVKPVWTERRAADRRAADSPHGPPGEERRTSRDRRNLFDPTRPRISPGLECGWLAFASTRERRRLAPVPENWEGLPDEALLALCRQAIAYPPRPVRLTG